MLNSEFVYGSLSVNFSRMKHNTWKPGLMRRVGEVLHFQTYSIILAVSLTVMSGVLAHIRIADKELHTRFGSVGFKRSAGHWFVDRNSQFRTLFLFVQLVTEIVALSQLMYVISNFSFGDEVVRSSLYESKLEYLVE